MQRKILIGAVILVLIVVGLGFQLFFRHAKAPVLVSRTDPPKISFENDSLDLGTIGQGNDVTTNYKIHNVGGEPLIIENVTATCDCTLLNPQDKYIEPGKIGTLEVILKTTELENKFIEKIDVYSNDPVTPRAEVTLSVEVQPVEPPKEDPKPEPEKRQEKENNPAFSLSMENPHAGLTDKDKTLIFTGQCATCHVAQGKGKTGGDLYQADCAMCHGQDAEGGLGPALVPGNYHDQEFINRIQKVTRYGSDRMVSMPGFLKQAGGPLTDREINSIVLFLQNKSDQMKTPSADVPGG